MSKTFSESLKSYRIAKSLSQQQLADKLFVDRSTVANWENGRRVPGPTMITEIAKVLDIDVGTLMSKAATYEPPVLLVIDDEEIILKGQVATIMCTFPDAKVTGFTSAVEALEYARKTKVDVVFTDIKLGTANGLNLCSELIKTNSRVNVVYVSAYPKFALEAWDTDACGFLQKPLAETDLKKAVSRFRFPVPGLI